MYNPEKWQYCEHKTQAEDKQNKKHSTICIGHNYMQTNINAVNKT
jgi:hypothetical protein